MTPEEIDSALDELENRLDRLRSLYEQYFLGIEKIEPAIARKDVDRRFWILRRTQIRNTMRRFRLQTLVQRYNTFQQHWTRICREIENGTYTRHLLKAKKNQGAEPLTWAAKKRLGMFRRDRFKEGTSEPAPSEPPAAEAQPDAAPPAGIERERAAPGEREGTKAQQPTLETRPSVTSSRREDLGLLDLDFDDAPPVERRAPAIPPEAAAAVSAAKPSPPIPAARPAPPIPAALAAKPAPVPPVAVAPVAVAPRTKPALPQPKAPTTAQGPKPPQPAAAVTTPAATKSAEPIAARAPVMPRPTAQSTESDAGGVSDERLRQLHAELVATRRKLNQADNVSIDSLAKSLRETATKLRAQHQGRAVDFHVVVKDGKPVVKPVVRK